MNRKNTNNYEMLMKVSDFGKQTVSLFPKSSAAAEVIKSLDSTVRILPEKVAARIAAENTMSASLATRIESRENLRRYLIQVSRLAASLESGPIQKPVNGSDQALIDSARGFVANPGPASKDFAKHGVEPDDVSAAVDALQSAIRGYNSAKAARSSAVKACDKAIADAMAVLPRFDALVENYLGDDVETISAYAIARSSRRLKAHRTRAKKQPTPAIPITPPPAVSTSATTAA